MWIPPQGNSMVKLMRVTRVMLFSHLTKTCFKKKGGREVNLMKNNFYSPHDRFHNSVLIADCARNFNAYSDADVNPEHYYPLRISRLHIQHAFSKHYKMTPSEVTNKT